RPRHEAHALAKDAVESQNQKNDGDVREELVVEVVEEAAHQTHDGRRVSESQNPVDPEEPASPSGHRRNVHRKAQNLSLDDGADVPKRVFPQVGNFDEARQGVVAVDLDEGIDVEEDGGDAGEEHRLVRELVQERVRGGGHPQERRGRTEEALDVDARRGDPQPMPLARKKERVGRLAVKSGSEVEERDADVVHLAAVDLDGVPVAELVEKPDEREDEEELESVDERLSAHTR